MLTNNCSSWEARALSARLNFSGKIIIVDETFLAGVHCATSCQPSYEQWMCVGLLGQHHKSHQEVGGREEMKQIVGDL